MWVPNSTGGRALDYESVLQTMAQVAATFGGLAAVIAAVRQDFSGGADHPFIVRDVVEISIIVTILSLFPFVPIGFGLAMDWAWQICCAVAWLLTTTGFGFSLRRGWQMWRQRRKLLVSTLGIYFIGSLFIVGSAMGKFAQAEMIYLSFLLILLGQAGVMFITVLIPGADRARG